MRRWRSHGDRRPAGAGQQPAATPELEHHTMSFSHRLQQLKHTRCARSRVDAEPAVMNEREISVVVRLTRVHRTILARVAEARGDTKAGLRTAAGPPLGFTRTSTLPSVTFRSQRGSECGVTDAQATEGAVKRRQSRGQRSEFSCNTGRRFRSAAPGGPIARLLGGRQFGSIPRAAKTDRRIPSRWRATRDGRFARRS